MNGKLLKLLRRILAVFHRALVRALRDALREALTELSQDAALSAGEEESNGTET